MQKNLFIDFLARLTFPKFLNPGSTWPTNRYHQYHLQWLSLPPFHCLPITFALTLSQWSTPTKKKTERLIFVFYLLKFPKSYEIKFQILKVTSSIKPDLAATTCLVPPSNSMHRTPFSVFHRLRLIHVHTDTAYHFWLTHLYWGSSTYVIDSVPSSCLLSTNSKEIVFLLLKKEIVTQPTCSIYLLLFLLLNFLQ